MVRSAAASAAASTAEAKELRKMCLAVPGRVTAVREQDGTRMAEVDFGGVVKDVCLAYLPEIEVGDYAIVHVGFALQRLDEASARATLDLFEQLGVLEEEFGDAWGRAAAEAGGAAPGGRDVPGIELAIESGADQLGVQELDAQEPGAQEPGAREPGVAEAAR
jgi:hydrogenase expression/formation protein HypC